VQFLVVNRGKVAHSFTIAGQKTPRLAPGKKAKLTILFSQPGSFKYASAVAGQSAKGMRGAFVVRAAPTAPGAPTVTPLQPGDTPVLPGSEACTNPVSTTVDVKIFEFGFTLSQTTIPCGNVTFNAKNIGEIAHTFDVEGTSPRGLPAFTGGAILLPGEAETHTVNYTVTGTYKYQCDRHYDQGAMVGQIKVVNG
jgi:plastocyanin